MLVDVTERHWAEAALRESEERFRTLVNSMDDIVVTVDREHRYGDFFGRWLEKFGLVSRDVRRKEPASEILGAKAGRVHEEAIKRGLLGEQVVFEWSSPIGPGDVLFSNLLSPIRERRAARSPVWSASGVISQSARERRTRCGRARKDSAVTSSLGSSEWRSRRRPEALSRSTDKMCEILGYERTELLQLTWEELTHPDDLAADLANFERILAAESDGYSMDKRFIRKDGGVIPATISVSCVRRADRSVDYFIALFKEDVTERKRAEQALRESRAHLYAILDNCPAMIFEKDLDGRYLQVNRQFERTFNLPPEQVILSNRRRPLPIGTCRRLSGHRLRRA